MFGLFATTAAVMAGSALAANVGSAVVVNQCSYPVYLSNVPAAGGGYSQIDKLLQTGDTYSQQWTALSNTNGWSIKLSQNGQYGSNIMQYEYTFQNDGTIWYDLSEVNGNPWNGNFEITAQSQSSCTPRQVAYRFATDDAYGMQDCPADSTITVALCSGADNAAGGSGSGSGSNAGSDSAPAETTEAAPSTPTQAAPTTTATPTTAAYTPPVVAAAVESPSQEVAPLSTPSAPSTPSTLSTLPTPSTLSTVAVQSQVATSQTDSTTQDTEQFTTAPPAETPAMQQTPTTLETVTFTEWVTIDTIETAWVNSKRHVHHPHQSRH